MLRMPKLVQINPKASSNDWGSSLTSIYAFRIKICPRGNQGRQLKQKILLPT